MTTEHLLYKAAVSFMVSERTHTESWEMVAKFASNYVDGSDVASLKAEFKTVEQQIKADFKIDALPAAWRSAKSVALKAVDKGVRLVDSHTGAVKGKTAVEKECKPYATRVSVAGTPQQELFYVLGKAIGLLAKSGFEFDSQFMKDHAITTTETLLKDLKKAKVK